MSTSDVIGLMNLVVAVIGVGVAVWAAQPRVDKGAPSDAAGASVKRARWLKIVLVLIGGALGVAGVRGCVVRVPFNDFSPKSKVSLHMAAPTDKVEQALAGSNCALDVERPTPEAADGSVCKILYFSAKEEGRAKCAAKVIAPFCGGNVEVRLVPNLEGQASRLGVWVGNAGKP